MTDETAKAILAIEDTGEPFALHKSIPFADLQKLARFWLLRNEIVDTLKHARPLLIADKYVSIERRVTDLLTKITGE